MHIVIVGRFGGGFPLHAALPVGLTAGNGDVTLPGTETKPGGRPGFPCGFRTAGDPAHEFLDIFLVQAAVSLAVHFPDAGAAVGVGSAENDARRR